jgi:hypothetical protein
MAKNKDDLGGLSDEDFMSEWDALGEESAQLRDRLRAYSQEHQRREAQKNLAQRLGTLSDPERAALLQYAQTGGIPTEESVNGA